MSEPESALKVFMLPWLAHGHITPFLELAKKLTKRNIFIYFCSTPINHQLTITKKLGLPYSKSIKVVEIHLPTLPNLPPRYHTTNGLPPHLMDTLKQAFEMSKDQISNIVSDLKPDFIIFDLAIMYAQIAWAAGIPSIMFSILGATAFSSIHHMATNPGQDFPFPSIYLHEYEKAQFDMLLNANKTGESNGVNSNANKASDPSEVKPTWPCDLRLVKSSREIEGKYIDYLTRSLEEKVIPVGLLLDQEPLGDDDSLGLVQWLNNKEKRSCILVAFGSECFLKNEEIEEIAYGLEISNINFIWVLRISQEKEGVKAEDILPKGFLDRVGERGRIIEGWAPQSMILRHQSIGGFMSHCGWCSVLESLMNGVPIIGMPMQVDQPFNARLVVEIGVGLEISREEKSGRVRREEVAKVVRAVLAEKGGDGVRRRAWEFREKILSKGEEEIDELTKELVLMNQKRKEIL